MGPGPMGGHGGAMMPGVPRVWGAYGRVGGRRGGRWDRERRERDWEEDELRGGRR